MDVGVDVQQGSVMGPIIFIAYVNFIDSIIHEIEYLAYPDDFTGFISSKNSQILRNQLQHVVENVSNLFSNLDLFLNTKKKMSSDFLTSEILCQVSIFL